MRKIKSLGAKLLKTQSFKNTTWNLASTILYPLLVLVTTPIFINKLGPTQFGIWMLINTTTQLMSVLNLGLGDANIKFISRSLALNDRNEIRNTVNSTFSVGLIVVLFGLLAGAILGYLIETKNWFNISQDLKQLAIESVHLAFLLFGLKFMEVVLLSVFQGFERYDRASLFSILSRTAILVANVLCVFSNATLVEVFISSCLLQLLFLIAEMLVLKYRYSFLTFRPTFRRAHIKKIFSFSVWTWLQSAMAIITTQADKFIVAYFSGVEILSYYSLGSMLTTQIHSIYVSGSSWVFPMVSKKNAISEPLNDFYKKSQALLLGFGFSSLILFLLLERHLVTLWLGSVTYCKSIEYIRLFIFYNSFLLINIIPYFFLNGAGHVKFNTLSELITKILNIIGMVVSFQFLNTRGLIWGLIFSMILATPIKISLIKKYVLHEKNRFFAIESTFCSICLVLLFETNNVLARAILALTFLWLFFKIYVQRSPFEKILFNYLKA